MTIALGWMSLPIIVTIASIILMCKIIYADLCEGAYGYGYSLMSIIAVLACATFVGCTWAFYFMMVLLTNN